MIKVFVVKDKGVSETLSEYFGYDVKISKTRSGAPFIENHPSYISLSHKDKCLVVAVSDKRVGVDVERIYEKESHKKIAERYFTDMEIEYAVSAERFFRLWTRKEAFAKLLGEGLSSRTIGIDVIKNFVTYEGQKYYLDTNTELVDGYCISVAGEESCAEYSIGIDER